MPPAALQVRIRSLHWKQLQWSVNMWALWEKKRHISPWESHVASKRTLLSKSASNANDTSSGQGDVFQNRLDDSKNIKLIKSQTVEEYWKTSFQRLWGLESCILRRVLHTSLTSFYKLVLSTCRNCALNLMQSHDKARNSSLYNVSFIVSLFHVQHFKCES